MWELLRNLPAEPASIRTFFSARFSFIEPTTRGFSPSHLFTQLLHSRRYLGSLDIPRQLRRPSALRSRLTPSRPRDSLLPLSPPSQLPMEEPERPHSHHISEKLPPASFETPSETRVSGQKGSSSEPSVVGQDLERSLASTGENEKGQDELATTTPNEVKFPDGGLRAWR